MRSKRLLDKNGKYDFLVKLILLIVLFFSFSLILKPLFYNNFPDFTSYYYAAYTFMEKGNPYLDRGKDFGLFLYPPPSLFLFIFLSFLPLSVAGKVFTGISIFCLIFSLYLLFKIVKIGPFSNLGMFLLIIAFNFFPTKFTLGMGQINNFVLLAVILFIYFYVKDEYVYSGLFISLASILKVWPLLLLLIPFLERNRKTLLSFFVFSFSLLILSFPFLGEEIYLYYFSNTLPNLFSSVALAYYNQSLPGFINELLGNGQFFIFIKYIFYIVLLLPIIYFCKFNRMNYMFKLLFFGFLSNFSILVVNNSWKHHFVWMLIPLFSVVEYLREEVNDFRYYLFLFLSYFLMTLNFKNSVNLPLLLKHHALWGALIFYLLTFRLLLNERIKV